MSEYGICIHSNKRVKVHGILFFPVASRLDRNAIIGNIDYLTKKHPKLAFELVSK